MVHTTAPRRRTIATLGLLLFSGACAAPGWVRPGHSPAENAADARACEQDSARAAARRFGEPGLTQIPSGYGPGIPDLPLRTGRGDLHSNEDAAARAARQSARLDEFGYRSDLLQDCMRRSGFEPVQ